MAVTPFLKPINNEGGTLYVFPSASRDLTRTFVSSDFEFKFSHFACLNLPNIYSNTDDEERTQKGLYLNTFKYSEKNQKGNLIVSNGMCKAIAEHLQNYVMNFETAILNGEGDNDDYDPDILTTVSEKVFFNWLQKVGAIEFDGNKEKFSNYEDRTVQYIGNIDAMNMVEINGDSFEELYLYIPSTVGASTSVLFRDGEDTDNKNYLNKVYSIGGANAENIIGCGATHPYGLSKTALFDIDKGGNMYEGDVGHTIDFRDASYSNGITNMNGESSLNFEFNAVLIYYDIFEKTKETNVRRTATNLYGILFLDGVECNDGAIQSPNVAIGYIKRYPKQKETIYGSGNSFALKVNLKVDTLPDTSSRVDVYSDPNSVVSMSMYQRALTQLQKCVDIFFEQRKTINKLNDRVEKLETLLLGMDSITQMRGEIDRLFNLYEDSGMDTGAILGLIEENSKKLNSILNGERNINLQFDTDVLQPGEGIWLQKSKNKVVINSSQRYAFNPIYMIERDEEKELAEDKPCIDGKSCHMYLLPGENFSILYIPDTQFKKSINIEIKDSEIGWEVGQSVKIYISGGQNSNEDMFSDGVRFGISITSESSADNKPIAFICGDDIEGHNLIELICVGENKFIHLIK